MVLRIKPYIHSKTSAFKKYYLPAFAYSIQIEVCTFCLRYLYLCEKRLDSICYLLDNNLYFYFSLQGEKENKNSFTKDTPISKMPK